MGLGLLELGTFTGLWECTQTAKTSNNARKIELRRGFVMLGKVSKDLREKTKKDKLQ